MPESESEANIDEEVAGTIHALTLADGGHPLALVPVVVEHYTDRDSVLQQVIR